MADLTAAQGRYFIDIQKAKLVREEARRSSMDTRRRAIQEEAYYEKMLPNALSMAARTKAGDLAWSRMGAPSTEVWSGKSLNVLLEHAISTGKLNSGPTIPLDEDTLKGINLTDKTSRANTGLLKDDGNLTWPLPLQEAQFDEARKRLTRNIRNAVQQLKKDKEPLQRPDIKNLQDDLKTLGEKLGDSVGELSPSQYIESRRYLNQLGDAVRALSDSRAVNFFNNTWTAKGKTVAELIDYMNRSGLRFAPAAAAGDEAAYTALYSALRAFDAGLQTASR
jgi:hypothetical protein